MTTSPGCEHPGCRVDEPDCIMECTLPAIREGEKDEHHYFCLEHCFVNGFYYGCGEFYGGVEAFECEPSGLCGDCLWEARQNEKEGSFDCLLDDDFDELSELPDIATAEFL